MENHQERTTGSGVLITVDYIPIMSKNFPSVSISNSALLYAEQLLKRGESLDSERDRTDTDGSSSEESDKKSNSREFSSDVKKFRTTSDSPPSKSPRKSNANYKTSKSCLKSENRIVTDERQLKFSSTGILGFMNSYVLFFLHLYRFSISIFLTIFIVTHSFCSTYIFKSISV